MSGGTHLRLAEREQLAALKGEGLSLRAIARRLGRAASTISRELRRNALPKGGYLPVHAEGCYRERRQRPALLHLRRPVVDGSPPGNGGARLASPPPAALGAATRQQLPELLGLLPGAVDEGVDGLGGDGAQPAFLAALEPASDLLRRPPLQKAFTHEATKLGITLHNRPPLAALEVAALSMDW